MRDLRRLIRAIAQTPKIERKRIYLPVSAPWLETFEAEVASFPMSKYYDQVDSMVQFLYLLDHRSQWTMELIGGVRIPGAAVLTDASLPGAPDRGGATLRPRDDRLAAAVRQLWSGYVPTS